LTIYIDLKEMLTVRGSNIITSVTPIARSLNRKSTVA